MFENLQDRFSTIFRKITGKSHLTEAAIKEALREVRLAFLEADVNIRATKDFCSKIQERALGEEVLKNLQPGQQVIKIVNEEMIDLLGKEPGKLDLGSGEARIMLVGLQGSGKTTTSAKLAKTLTAEGRKPFLCAADIYRPAAIEQLHTVGKQVNVPVFDLGTDHTPAEIAKQGTLEARRQGCDTIILDTAGRLHIDEAMMQEVKSVKDSWKPTHVILVVDAMVGQDAVNQAKHFHEGLGITGTILTKLDSDTRGGAAISIRYVTGKPILFAGIGEKLDQLEPFYPDRMASRILGMGDVLTLIEKAKAAIDEDEAMRLHEKIKKQTFTFNDFLSQIRSVRKMGGIGSLMSMIPGMGNSEMLKQATQGENEMRYIEAMILSMTKKERESPNLMNSSRKRRIAAGSGTSLKQVNRLLKQFAESKQMMSMMTGGTDRKGKPAKLTKKMKKKMMKMQNMFPGQ